MKIKPVFVWTALFGLFSPSIGNGGGMDKTTFPLCGVLSTRGYREPEAKQKFGEAAMNAVLAVPSSLQSPFVRRYQLVDRHRLPGFLAAHLNWWVCIGKGKVIKETAVGESLNAPKGYGILIVEEFSADMSNGERGGE